MIFDHHLTINASVWIPHPLLSRNKKQANKITSVQNKWPEWPRRGKP
jgi:hypothetical protein